jgi:hypothetical protein
MPPSSTASGGYKGRPPPTIEHPFFLLCLLPPHCATIPAVAEPSRTTRSGLSPTDSTTPRAPRRQVQPPCTASCRPPPPDITPTAIPLRPTTPHRRAHSSGELLPSCCPKMGPPPYRLAPRNLPATPCRRPPLEFGRAATSAAVAERPPLSPLRWATSPSGWARPKQAGQF